MDDDVVEIVEPKKRGRPNDYIWAHYEKITDKKNPRLAGKCRFCASVVQDGRPENLYKHIHECVSATSEVKAEAIEMQAKKAVSAPLPSKGLKRKSTNLKGTSARKGDGEKQIKVSSYCQRRLPDATVQTIHVKLLRTIIMCSLAFVIVENPFFIDFIQTLCPGYVPPGMVFVQ
jgi:hypothetical protein